MFLSFTAVGVFHVPGAPPPEKEAVGAHRQAVNAAHDRVGADSKEIHPCGGGDNDYDVIEHYGIERAIGSLCDFVQRINEADARGRRVVIDLVVNHTSNRRPWLLQARADPADRIPVCGGLTLIADGYVYGHKVRRVNGDPSTRGLSSGPPVARPRL